MGADTRSRTTVLKAWLIAFASEHGISLRQVPQSNSLAAEFSPDRRHGNLTGARGWTLRASSRYQTHDISTLVSTLRREQEDNGDPYAAAFVELRVQDGGEHAPWVIITPETWAAVVNALEDGSG